MRRVSILGRMAPTGHEETLASKESCPVERPVDPRQPTFMNAYTMAVDRPKPPLAIWTR